METGSITSGTIPLETKETVRNGVLKGKRSETLACSVDRDDEAGRRPLVVSEGEAVFALRSNE
jgi:hypothetical protein